MADFNKVILLGRLTRDPEVRYSGSGVAVCKMGLAVNRRVKKQGNWEEEAHFFDIVAFGSQGENAGKYLSKGRQVLIEGELTLNRWTNQEGQNRSKVEIVANTVQFLGQGSGGGGGGGGRSVDSKYDQSPSNDEPPPLDDDDIPF